MSEHESLSPLVKSISMRISRRAMEYALRTDQRGGLTEQKMLDMLDGHVEQVVSGYKPPGLPPGSLVFAHVYAAAWEGRIFELDPDQEALASTALLAALLAAEVEFRGPLRLTSTQNMLLADVYERLGGALMGVDLPAHAALAFRRAAGLNRLNEDVEAEDRCGLELARARCRAEPNLRLRLLGYFSDLLCGYGYRPFRLLGWVAGQLLLFLVIGLLIIHSQSLGKTAYMCLTAYLNPPGMGDVETLGTSRSLFVAEAWAGTVSMSVFFALLVRRWFRL